MVTKVTKDFKIKIELIIYIYASTKHKITLTNTHKSVPAESLAAHKHVHPVVFMFLIIPYGVVIGFITVTLAFLYAHQGISVSDISILVAASLAPTAFSFLWSPLVDTTLSVKKWYLLAITVTCIGLAATGVLPIKQASMPLLTVLAVAATVASTFVSTATNNFMVYDTPANMKGRAGGYLQAGNLGGSGIGGGAGLLLAKHLSAVWMPGAIIALVCMLCCFGLFFVTEPRSTIRTEKVLETVTNLLKDLWNTIKEKAGYLALFLCLLPLGTGAASNLWAAVAKDWNASAETVAFVTGIASGLISVAGCLLGGWICDRIDRKTAYVSFGLLQGACALGMAFCPHTQFMYIFWTSVYAVANGFAYAGYTAFVLEAMGKGAASTKMSLFSSLSNTPIILMTRLDGWAYGQKGVIHGPVGMLVTEAACALIAAAVFIGVQMIVKRGGGVGSVGVG